MRKLSHQEIVLRQQSQKVKQRLPFSVVLNNIRSLYNVGAIFRTSDGVGLEKLWLCGITGHPPHPQLSKTALGAEDQIPWEHRTDAISVVKALKKKGYQIVLLEQMEKSVPYQDFIPQAPVCLVVGNEINGVSDELGSLCHSAIEIEMAGLKNSLNVAVAFGIVAYHIRNQILENPKLTES